MASAFLTDRELAQRAFEAVRHGELQLTPLNRLQRMVAYIQKNYYHIVSEGIQAECRSLVGL